MGESLRVRKKGRGLKILTLKNDPATAKPFRFLHGRGLGEQVVVEGSSSLFFAVFFSAPFRR